MKAIYKGNNFSIVWNIINRSTQNPFDFTGLSVEVGIYSDNCKSILQSYTIESGTITAQVGANTLPAGVYHLICRYASKSEQAYCSYRNAFQITARPIPSEDVETITLTSVASHIDSTSEEIPQPEPQEPHECELTAEELWDKYFRLPELTADRAIADEQGNRITDTYITRQAVTKHIKQVYNQQFIENPPLITDGYITPEMLSEETRELLENTGQEIHNLPDGEDLTSVHGVLKLANKEYNSATYSGLGRQYLRKNIVAGVNILTQSMINKPNTIYIIQYDYDLQGDEITIPEGCVLDFQGGSLNNGIIIGNNTEIIASLITIFKENIKLEGFWKSIEPYPEWFGEKLTSNIQKCVDIFNNATLNGNYIYDKTITIGELQSIKDNNRKVLIDASSNNNGYVLVIHLSENAIELKHTSILISKNRNTDVVYLYGSSQHTGEYRYFEKSVYLPYVYSLASLKHDTMPDCNAFVFDVTNDNITETYEYNYASNNRFHFRAHRVNKCLYIKTETKESSGGKAFSSNCNYYIESWWCNYGLIIENPRYWSGGAPYFYIFWQPSEQSKKIVHFNVNDFAVLNQLHPLNWRFDIVPWDLSTMQSVEGIIDNLPGATYYNCLTHNRLSRYFTNKFYWRKDSAENDHFVEDIRHGAIIISNISYITRELIRQVTSDTDRKTAWIALANGLITEGYNNSVTIYLDGGKDNDSGLLMYQTLFKTFLPENIVDVTTKIEIYFNHALNSNPSGSKFVYAELKGENQYQSIHSFIKFLYDNDENISDVIFNDIIDIKTLNGKSDSIVSSSDTHSKTPITSLCAQFDAKAQKLDIIYEGILEDNGTYRLNKRQIALIKSSNTILKSLPTGGEHFFCTDSNVRKPFWWTGGKFVDSDGNDAIDGNGNILKHYGTNSDRPGPGVIKVGFQYFNTSFNVPTWKDANNKFVEADGNPSGINRRGSTNNRPSNEGLLSGTMYFDTNLNKPIWWTGTKWVDATGAEV